jgi:hypothetical protein
MHTLRHSFLLVAALTGSLVAQNDYNLDKTSAGTLGSSLNLAIQGAPANSLFFSMPSFTAGPTPVALVDPSDPRSVQVGLDLSSSWTIGFTDGNGAGGIGLGLPNIPSLAGTVMHWQTVTVPGSSGLIGQISNDVVAQLGSSGSGRLASQSLAAARSFAAMLANPTFNQAGGDVLVAGGGAGTLTAATGLASTEIWDFRHMTRRAGPNMTGSRALHCAVPLLDGRVLIVGGADSAGNVLSTCEIYDPVSNSFSATGSMGTSRVLHAAARLGDGRVLVAGGTSTLVDTTTAISSTLRSAEIYNPATGSWSGAANIGGYRLAPALTSLPNGNVMCSGGVQVGYLFGIPISASSTTAVQVYNASSNSWSGGPSMPAGRAGHHFNQVTLADGRILMSGGVSVPSLLGATSAAPIGNADLYNPATNSWQGTSMGQSRSLHTATRLQDGRIAVCGGAQGTLTAPISVASAEVFDPNSNTWSALQGLASARSGHVAALMPDGLLVLFGGQAQTATTTSIEVLHF